MRKQFHFVACVLLLAVFVFGILRTSTLSFESMNEDAIEELVDLNERDLEEEYTLSFDFYDASLFNSLMLIERLNQYFHCHGLKLYNEPNPKSLFTPPDFS